MIIISTPLWSLTLFHYRYDTQRVFIENKFWNWLHFVPAAEKELNFLEMPSFRDIEKTTPFAYCQHGREPSIVQTFNKTGAYNSPAAVLWPLVLHFLITTDTLCLMCIICNLLGFIQSTLLCLAYQNALQKSLFLFWPF